MPKPAICAVSASGSPTASERVPKGTPTERRDAVYALAKELRVSRSRINDICLGKHGITANIALRMGRFFNVDPRWFMNMQAKYDLHVEEAGLAKELAAIKP